MKLEKVLRISVIGIVFLIPIFPLIVADSFFFPFITGKAFYFRILVELAFAGWAILAFLDARYRPKLSPLTAAVTLFALVTLLADLLGVNPLRSIWSNFERMEGWLVIVHLWALYLVTTYTFGADAEGHRWWHRWFNMTLAVATIVGIYGLVQLAGGAAIHQGSTRIDASLGNAAYMAVYMLVHSFIAAYLYFFTRHNKHSSSAAMFQWVYAILAVLFAFLVFQTATRGTILALIGGVILSSALYAVFARKESNRSRYVALGIIAVILAVGGAFWANRDAQFVQNSEVLNRLAHISINETKTQARGYIWPMAITGFKERPIFGWGQENFNYIFNKNYNPAMWNQEQWFDRAHNVYLDWLTASGAVGLVVYLALYVLVFMGIWKSSFSIREKSVLTGLVAAYAVHNVFVFDNLASYAFFFAFLGFINSSAKEQGKAILGTKPLRLDAVEYIVAPIVIVLLIGSIYFLNIRPIQANTRLISALQDCNTAQPNVAVFKSSLGLDQYMANQEVREQLLTCTHRVLSGIFPNNIKEAYAGLVTEEIQKQISLTPDDARIYALAGSFYNSLGQFALSQPLLEKALVLSPGKQSVILQMVNTYFNLGKIDESLKLLKDSYEGTPSHTEVKNAYARVLIFAGREAEARQIFNNDPAVFEDPIIAQIYANLEKYNEAIALLKKLIEKDPSNVDLQGQLARVQFAAGRKYEAIETLQRVAREHPEFKQQVEATIQYMNEQK